MKTDRKDWEFQFFLLIIIQMILAGILYLMQQNLNLTILAGSFIRMIRMTLVYVFPSFFFIKVNGMTLCDLGLCPCKERRKILISIFGGGIIYALAGIVFLKFQIFFYGWALLSPTERILNLLMIGIMAAITDYWTRGFILLIWAKKHGEFQAIVLQNIIWFIIHLYEIILLIPYIGLLGSILLTLFLGISGDFIALYTRNIYGLMLGHFVLNLMIAIGALTS